MSAHGITDPIDPGEQDEPTRDALALNRHHFQSSRLRTLHERDTFASEEVQHVLRFSARRPLEPAHSAVDFGIGVGGYEGVVSVPRRVFQTLLSEAPTPERCLEAYHLHRTRLELIAERKLRRRQLTDDGNVEITGRDLREREGRAHYRRPIGYRRAVS